MSEKQFNGFRLDNGMVDNDKCPHLHMIVHRNRLNCQTCGKDYGCAHMNYSEYFEKCDDCGYQVSGRDK